MSKSRLREVSAMRAGYIEDAIQMAKKMVLRESRGPGDTDNAMRRLQTKYGVDYSFLWALKYRVPKDLLMGPFLRLFYAYEKQREEQMKRFEHERGITQVTGRFSSYLVSAADALARAQDRKAEEPQQ